eukprot:gene9413-1620_t
MSVYTIFNKETISSEEYIDAFMNYVERAHKEELEDILSDEDTSLHFTITANGLDLMNTSVRLGTLLFAYPIEIFEYFNEGIKKVQRKMIKESDGTEGYLYKPFVHGRISSLPMTSENCKSTVSNIRSSDTNHFISVSGTVIRTGSVKMLQAERTYICQTCKEEIIVKADIERGNTINKPTQCIKLGCSGDNFKPIQESELCRDYQEIRIQDKVSMLQVGSIPRSINIVLEDDLVDVCKAGDDVTIIGVVLRRWKSMKVDSRCDIELILLANNVIVNNASKGTLNVTEEQKREFQQFWEHYKKYPLTGRNLILKSMCPQIYGLYLVKLSVALTLIGGVQMMKDSTKIRGESHLLLIGDPGTGKSQFLKYASKLSPRNVLTNGIGTTSAGLTVMATKDVGGDWTLEAGALVLADGGVCCIDEFDSIREHDRATIHEAMEQQTLSIAKAGLVCKLNTRTTVIAATNPKGKYDLSSSLSVNCNIASPLLSRFDLVLILLDTQDEEWDTKVSNFILKEEQQFDDLDTKNIWSFEKLQAYFGYVKNNIKPKITRESGEILTKYYQLQRKMSDRIAARTTIRLLESLVRLAQAHARLMFREEVTIQDAIFSVLIIDSSLHMSNLLGIYSVLHSSFPDTPDSEYRNHEAVVLEKLGLSEEEFEESQESITEDFDFSHLIEEEKRKDREQGTQYEEDAFGLNEIDMDSEDEIIATNSKFDRHLEQRKEQKQMKNFLNQRSKKPSTQSSIYAHTEPTFQNPIAKKNSTQKSSISVVSGTQSQKLSVPKPDSKQSTQKSASSIPQTNLTSLNGSNSQQSAYSLNKRNLASHSSSINTGSSSHKISPEKSQSQDFAASQTSEASSNLLEEEEIPTGNTDDNSFNANRFIVNNDYDSLGISDISVGSPILFDDDISIDPVSNKSTQKETKIVHSQILDDDFEEVKNPIKSQILDDDDDELPSKIEKQSQILDDDEDEISIFKSQILDDDNDEKEESKNLIEDDDSISGSTTPTPTPKKLKRKIDLDDDDDESAPENHVNKKQKVIQNETSNDENSHDVTFSPTFASLDENQPSEKKKEKKKGGFLKKLRKNNKKFYDD